MKPKFIYLLIVFLTFTLSSSFADESKAKLDPRAEQLLRKFDSLAEYKRNDTRWMPENGPWAPYLERPFAEGLGPKETALYEKTLRNGDCHTVRALQLTGFLLLYPFLQPAHARMAVGTIFDETVLTQSLDHRYCFTRLRLNRALGYYKENNREIPLIRADLLAKGIDSGISSDTPENRAYNELCYALSSISHYALSDGYLRAIEDLLQFSSSLRILRLPGESEYYLYHRAKHLGLKSDDIDKAIDTSFHRVKPARRHKIDELTKSGKNIHRIPTSWRCPKPHMKWGEIERKVFAK